MMRRWSLVVVMLLVLPFQLVWAAAVPFCAHETQASVKKHFGHHEHQHQSSSLATASDDVNSERDTGSGSPHFDCETCHFGTSVAVASPTPLVTPQPPGTVQGDPSGTYRSHIPPGIDRPDRLRLTSAARFGDGVESSPHPV